MSLSQSCGHRSSAEVVGFQTPPKGSRPPPKLPSSSSDWRPSLRGDKARDRSASASRPSKPQAEAGRKAAQTVPAAKEAGRTAAPSKEDLTPAFKGRRYERGSTADVPRDLQDQPSSSSSAPARGRSRRRVPVESEPLSFGGRSKDRWDYSPRLVSINCTIRG